MRLKISSTEEYGGSFTDEDLTVRRMFSYGSVNIITVIYLPLTGLSPPVQKRNLATAHAVLFFCPNDRTSDLACFLSLHCPPLLGNERSVPAGKLLGIGIFCSVVFVR